MRRHGGQRGERIGDLGILVAEHDGPRRIAVGKEPRQVGRLGDLGKRKDAALLGGFDGVRPHALEIDARHLAVAGEHRLQPRGAHLDRLLHHVVEPRRFERREQIMQVGRHGLVAGFGADDAARPRAFAPSSAALHSPSRPLKTRTPSPDLRRSTVVR